MACASPPKLCTTCQTSDSEQKPKPGILSCTGCQKYFCSKHMIQHRQYLTDLLENGLVNEINKLQETLRMGHEQQWFPNVRVQLEAINKWEFETIELIRQSAANARKHLHDITLNEGDQLQKQFVMLSAELNTLREDENYLENDIDQLTKKCQQLKVDIEHFPIEVSMTKISNELISVKTIVRPASTGSPALATLPSYFIDQLLIVKKPEILTDISVIKPAGQMYPLRTRLITFHSAHALSIFNITKTSWKSLDVVSNAIELHWADGLNLFLAIRVEDQGNGPFKELYQIDPSSRAVEEIWKKPPHWNTSFHSNLTTLTCFKENIIIVLTNKIEKWILDDKEWYTSRETSTTWRPPISCQLGDEITCIRMNDQYYALIITKIAYRKDASRSVFYFELRNHGMSPLRRIQTEYDNLPDKMRLFSLPNACGWLFFFYEKKKKYCYVLDNNAERYDQNIVLSSDVTDIAVYNDRIFLRKKNENNGVDVIEIYDCREKENRQIFSKKL